jgi:hypothetical protein
LSIVTVRDRLDVHTIEGDWDEVKAVVKGASAPAAQTA